MNMYNQVQHGFGHLVISPTKKKRNEAIVLLHAQAKKLKVRLKTEKISPTRFYSSIPVEALGMYST